MQDMEFTAMILRRWVLAGGIADLPFKVIAHDLGIPENVAVIKIQLFWDQAAWVWNKLGGLEGVRQFLAECDRDELASKS